MGHSVKYDVVPKGNDKDKGKNKKKTKLKIQKRKVLEVKHSKGHTVTIETKIGNQKNKTLLYTLLGFGLIAGVTAGVVVPLFVLNDNKKPAAPSYAPITDSNSLSAALNDSTRFNVQVSSAEADKKTIAELNAVVAKTTSTWLNFSNTAVLRQELGLRSITIKNFPSTVAFTYQLVKDEDAVAGHMQSYSLRVKATLTIATLDAQSNYATVESIIKTYSILSKDEVQ